ncbi:MAG TPA: ABC transporter permease [Terracidiphilus sp.]|nr:ABC transporter permease [Terracidiphilus sp.]
MRFLRSFLMRLRGTIGTHHDDDFSTELESHIAHHVEDGVRAGLAPEEARRQALVRLGGAEQTRQAHRDRATLPWLETLARDLRSCMRSLRKQPTIAAVAILSIALGVGANATIFSMVSRFVLQPPPVGDPATLVALHTMPKGDHCCSSFSLPLFEDLQANAKSFSGVAAYFDFFAASVGENGPPERVWGQGVTANFFDVVQMKMVKGRGFAANEKRAPVVVLSEGLWRGRFNADPGIIGNTIQISGHTFTVVGIAPAAFHSIDKIFDIQFWVPLDTMVGMLPTAPSPTQRNSHWLEVIARLRPGVTHKEADAELQALSVHLRSDFPDGDEDWIFAFDQAGTLPPRIQSMVRIFLAALMAVVLLVLAIAGANVANLLFAQAVARQREMAVRLALGATRTSLRRLVLLESLLLSLAGGILGVALSLVATRGLAAFHFPAPVPIDLSLAVDGHVLLYSFLASVACGMLLGAGPAWAASHPRLARALKGEDALASPGRRFSLRGVLVVGQVAMAVVLLSMTGLFLRSLQSASTIDIGFRTKGVTMLSIDPRLNGYSAQRTADFLQQLRDRALALPGVDEAAITDVPMLSGGNRSDGFSAVGKNAAHLTADLYIATPGFFRTLGIPLLAGRDFANEPTNGPRVAVVNRYFAEKLFPNANPIGQHVQGPDGTFEIIGIVGNTKSRTLGEELRPMLFRTLNQTLTYENSFMGYTLIVHTNGSTAALAEPLRRLVYTLDPAIAVFNQETMDTHIRSAYFLPRLAATLFGIMGFIGLVLASVGLYGVMSYSVSRRTHEIGIRMALGAQAHAVSRMVLRQGLRLAIVAIVLGWPAAWFLAKLSSSFLYGVAPHDALTFAAVPVMLVAIALIACWIPARRAASVDPMETLRTE